ncbi:MAG TPA: MarR family transcriptional regulator [Stellaceae bacterium]|nr:MarR family transcriptional regulator [Stellaceae bacterium]
MARAARATQAGLVPLVIADLYELAGAFRRNGERIARGLGQTQTRWQVLSAASAEPKSVPQLARRLGVTRQNVQRIADLLVADELARFAGNPDHRTSPHLVLTEAGRKALDELTRAAQSFHESLAARLGAVPLASVRRELSRIRSALATISAEEDADE